MSEGGNKKIDVASAQLNLTAKLPPEMKNTLTSQQNLCPTVWVDTNAFGLSLPVESKRTEFPEKKEKA